MNDDSTKKVDAEPSRPPRTRDVPVETIDFSDIPPVRDWTSAVRVRDYPDRKSAIEAARQLYWAKRRAAE